MWIDAHCHLEKETYGEDLPRVVNRAHAAGVHGFIVVGASGVTQGVVEAITFAENHAEAYVAAGIHPHDIEATQEHHLQHLDDLLKHPKVVTLGEVGLDYFHHADSKAKQKKHLKRFFSMANEHNVPVMLHIRDAFDDFIAFVDDVGFPEQGAVIHCFTGDSKQAKAYLERGFYLSIPGVVTFKNAEALREALLHIPLDRLLVETDCPFLTPAPHRGKKNEPAYVALTAAFIANHLNICKEQFAAKTCENAVKLFKLPISMLG